MVEDKEKLMSRTGTIKCQEEITKVKTEIINDPTDTIKSQTETTKGMAEIK